jgi:hypothetical protein
MVPILGRHVAPGIEANLSVPARFPCCHPDTGAAIATAGRSDAWTTANVETPRPSAATTIANFNI